MNDIEILKGNDLEDVEDIIRSVYNFLQEDTMNYEMINDNRYLGIMSQNGLKKLWICKGKKTRLLMKLRKNDDIESLHSNSSTYVLNNASEYIRKFYSIKYQNIRNIDTYTDKSFQSIMDENKEITKIIVTGSCDVYLREGSYTCWMILGDKYKKITKELRDTTANKCILTGVIDAISFLKRPIPIEVITTTQIGIRMGLRGSGQNFDLVKPILDKVISRDIHAKFYACEGEGKIINDFVDGLA